MAENGNRIHREKRMLYEYIAKFYPKYPKWIASGARIGPLPGVEKQEYYKVIRQYPDAIVFTGKEVIIMEAKLFQENSAIGQLLSYREYFPTTPEFEMWKNVPIRLQLVSPRPIKEIMDLATKMGIEYIVYKPDWVDAYYYEVLNREKR